MTIASQVVLFEVSGNIAVISLNRSERRNAINAETTRLLREAFDRFENDAQLAVAVLRGNGPVFCSGMDLQAFVNGEADEILFGRDRFAGFVSRKRTKPVVAAVHGAAVAGGFEIMISCDLAVSTQSCRFGLPEAQRGLVAGGGGAFRLGERLPRAVANEILLTGATFGATRAKDLGLVNKVVPDDSVDQESIELARVIARNAPLSTASSLLLVRAPSEERQEKLWEQNDRLLRRMIDSSDAREGALAFAAKRQPIWRGL